MLGPEAFAAIVTGFLAAFLSVGREPGFRAVLARTVLVRELRRVVASDTSSGSDDMTKCFFAVDNTQRIAIFVSSFLEGFGAARAVFWPLPRAKKKTQEEPTAARGGSMRLALAAMRRARCGVCTNT